MLKQYIRDIYIYLIYHKYWTCVALSKCAFLLSAHTAIDVILWFLLHPSKDFLLKSSNGSFVDIKLHFKSLTSEIQFHHEGCCTLLPTSKHHCKPFKDSEQSQCGELTSQYTLYFSHQILLDFNQGQQLLSVNINFKWIINLCWIFFFVCVSETTPKDNLLTAEYISFHMHFVSHCFLFASAFIFSSYDALFPPRGFVGMLAYICVFLSVWEQLQTAQLTKVLPRLKTISGLKNISGYFSSPVNCTPTDRHNSLMQTTLINISPKAIFYSVCYDLKKHNFFYFSIVE